MPAINQSGREKKREREREREREGGSSQLQLHFLHGKTGSGTESLFCAIADTHTHTHTHTHTPTPLHLLIGNSLSVTSLYIVGHTPISFCPFFFYFRAHTEDTSTAPKVCVPRTSPHMSINNRLTH